MVTRSPDGEKDVCPHEEVVCPYYGICGGCSFQHLSYQAQLDAKAAILAEALVRAGSAAGKLGTDTLFPSITVIPSKPWEYRNRVSLHAIRSNRFPRCGFKARRSGKIIPLDDCPSADPGIRWILPRLLPPPGKDRFTLYSKDETLIAETGTVIAEGGKTGANKQIPSSGTIDLFNHGGDAAPEHFRGRKITLEAASFFQNNAGALESLVLILRNIAENIARKAGNAAVMADLYAGVGTFSVFLADLFPAGTDLLESDSRALKLAKVNLERMGYTAGRFFFQKVEQWAGKRNLGAYTFIVADPPRQGLAPALVRSLCRSGPEFFVYISCEASTFARDTHILAQTYRAESLFLFDFYPQTSRIETMGLFSRK